MILNVQVILLTKLVVGFQEVLVIRTGEAIRQLFYINGCHLVVD